MGHAMKLAADFIHTHPDESIAILKKRFPNVSEPALKASYEAVRDMTPQPPTPNSKELGNAEDMNVAAGFMKAEDKLKSYEGLFTVEFAK
jgi:ABC-type nitrate/sulfonate/bicarbonate transport system substrate-binding protein